MDDVTLHIDPSNNRQKKTVGNFLRKILLVDKFSGWLGFTIFFIISFILAYAIAESGMKIAFMAIAFCVALPVVYFLVVKPEFGIMVYLTLAYTIMWFLRYGVGGFPLGTLMDGMLALFALGMFIQIKQNGDWHLLKGKVSLMILIWVLYTLMQVANPAAESRLAWVYTVRTVGLVTLMYFIFTYNIRTKNFIKLILKWWIFWSFVNACYAFKQEYFGFADFEQQWLNSTPELASLLFLAGHWRKFSIFSDPVTFAYNMATASLLCLALITGPIKTYRKLILGFLAVFFLYVMLFSGTRGAFPLVPAAFMLYAILKFNRQILIFTVGALMFIVFLIFLPTSNQNILRFQTAFRPSNDASYKVREMNQARIKPYIYTHPIGGGLGATGEWGIKFAPNSFLAHFPPDSGYVRTTVELGWIGLFIFSYMIFTILKTGVDSYYEIKDPELKSYSLATVLMVFTWNIGNFPQQALVQYPSNVLFFLAVALMGVIYRIDQQQNLEINGKL